ncbi:unnamed protein product [Pleuronectes platessa]|uniref:Uncharacterized protein n=1 Tax=Pleuronectes platessa TaxID=8262 RepID=A0A9N7UQ24_PLEPL|nr:unnamed protein product [Pleuronectes platessa]
MKPRLWRCDSSSWRSSSCEEVSWSFPQEVSDSQFPGDGRARSAVTLVRDGNKAPRGRGALRESPVSIPVRNPQVFSAETQQRHLQDVRVIPPPLHHQFSDNG